MSTFLNPLCVSIQILKKIKLESSFHSSQNCTPLRARNEERDRVRDRLGYPRRLGRWPSAKNQRSLQGPLGSSAVCLLWPASAERAPTRLSPETQRAAARLLHVVCSLQSAAFSLPPPTALPPPQFYRPARRSSEPPPGAATRAGLGSSQTKKSQNPGSFRASARAEGARLGD